MNIGKRTRRKAAGQGYVDMQLCRCRRTRFRSGDWADSVLRGSLPLKQRTGAVSAFTCGFLFGRLSALVPDQDRSPTMMDPAAPRKTSSTITSAFQPPVVQHSKQQTEMCHLSTGGKILKCKAVLQSRILEREPDKHPGTNRTSAWLPR